jgi:hypothetical protein
MAACEEIEDIGDVQDELKRIRRSGRPFSWGTTTELSK